MNNYKLFGLAVMACIISFSIGKYSGLPKSESIKTETVAETKKTDTTRVVDKKETILPDGTRVIETVTSTKRLTDSESNKDISNKTVSESRPEWRANLLYFPDIPNYQEQFGIIDVQKRILSEVYFGVSVSSKKQIGLSFSIGF